MKEHTFIKLVVALIAIVFIVHQLYSALYKPITTVSAEYYEAVDGLSVSASIFRTEKLITNTTAGTLHFTVSDGERAKKGGVIASVYESAAASMTVSRISELEKQISNIEQMQSYNDKQAADLDLANLKVQTAVDEYVTACATGNFGEVSESRDELLIAMNRRSLITGEQTDFSEQLASLNSELDALKASLPAVKANVTTDTSGYFLSATDGYELAFTCENLDNITPEFLAEARPSDIPTNVIGKVVSDYEWYIAATVSLDQSLKYKQGDTLTVKTKLKSSPMLSVTVKQVNMSSSGDEAAVILACSDMNSELCSLRNTSITIVNETYSGLRLPKKALRVVKEKTGVYVVSGMALKFVPVEVIYSTADNGYIICKQEKSNEDVLRLYDEVVVKGKKLYDGKIIG